MLGMDTVVDLLQWRRTRRAEGVDEVERLERAIEHLDAVASASLEGAGPLAPWVETELLAILGALAADMLSDAAVRAERLAGRLAGRTRSAGR
jgi:hypothetical protein